MGTLSLAATHVIGAGALLWAGRNGQSEAATWSWLPLLVVPLLYAEIPLLNQWRGEGFFDPMVQGWEAALFPSLPARNWAAAMPWTWLSETLHVAYLSYYPLIFGPALALTLTGRKEGLRRGTWAVVATFLVCFVFFVVFPVQGPRYLFPAPVGIPDGPVRGLVTSILETGSSRGAAFPSLHVGLAVTQALIVGRYFGKVWGGATALLAMALAAGAVYGGFHYAVDAVAGAGIGALAFGASARVGRRQSAGGSGIR